MCVCFFYVFVSMYMSGSPTGQAPSDQLKPFCIRLANQEENCKSDTQLPAVFSSPGNLPALFTMKSVK